MGYDLFGAGGMLRLETLAWKNMLALATYYGWHPEGTLAPTIVAPGGILIRPGNWTGGYFENSYQRVTAIDASSLAAALESALPDIPTHNCQSVVGLSLNADGERDHRRQHATRLEILSGPVKSKVSSLIDYCRKGTFVIA